MNNLLLLRDVIDICKVPDRNIDILSLDQEKDFNKVDHTYLNSVSMCFVLGMFSHHG